MISPKNTINHSEWISVNDYANDINTLFTNKFLQIASTFLGQQDSHSFLLFSDPVSAFFVSIQKT